MDAVDPVLVDRAGAVITGVEGVDEVRDLRIRWIDHPCEAHLPARVPRPAAATIHASPRGAPAH